MSLLSERSVRHKLLFCGGVYTYLSKHYPIKLQKESTQRAQTAAKQIMSPHIV